MNSNLLNKYLNKECKDFFKKIGNRSLKELIKSDDKKKLNYLFTAPKPLLALSKSVNFYIKNVDIDIKQDIIKDKEKNYWIVKFYTEEDFNSMIKNLLKKDIIE